MATPAPADPNLNREMDELAAQMNNLNIGRNPQNPAVPQNHKILLFHKILLVKLGVWIKDY